MGVLQNAAEFFALFNNGRRGGQCRYFTYSLMRDSLRCSETGAKFSTDMFSKHAMHAGAAAEVLYAGGWADGRVSGMGRGGGGWVWQGRRKIFVFRVAVA
jgi:hypothetical protein